MHNIWIYFLLIEEFLYASSWQYIYLDSKLLTTVFFIILYPPVKSYVVKWPLDK